MKVNLFKKAAALLTAAALCLSAAGCAPQAGQNNSSGASGELKKFKVLLDWTPNTNHTGMYVAKEKGYYKDAGLDVEIVSADGANVLEMLAGGSADVGVSFEESVTAARAGSPALNVKAVAAILQENTSGFAAEKSKNIKSVKDLEGKTYGSWGNDIETALLKHTMEKGGADYSKVNVKVINALDTLTMLKTQADFAWIYYGWDGIAAECQDNTLDFILLQDVDPDFQFYSPLLASSDKTLEEKPEEMKAFLKATAKGYEYARDHSDESAEILYNVNKDLDLAMLKKSQAYVNKYSFNENGEWGVMKDSVWENFTNLMADKKAVSTKPDYKTLYTNDYLK